MKSYPIGTGSLLSLTIAVLLGQGTIAAAQEDAKMTEAEAKMFSMSADYERFMGRWSRLLGAGLHHVCGHQERRSCARRGYRDRLGRLRD